MAKWASAAALDGGIDYIRANCDFQTLVKAYSPGDSMATIISNTVAEVAMVSGDYTKGSVGSDRTLTTPASGVKSANASAGSGASPDLHLVFHDGTDPHWVTDETTDQVITAPNPVDFPQVVYRSKQPT